MWPKLVDLSPDECKRTLRRLELEAYSSVVSAFRAQGSLSKDKKKLLHELQNVLSISLERHRAEVRRAVNDEKLTTIADHNSSSTTETSDWLIEGRRLIPLLPRLVPQTAFTSTANQAAKEASEKNLHLINPALTGNKELATQSSVPAASAAAMATAGTKASRPTSPTSNVVVLPSGTSIHIKGVLNPEEEEEMVNRRQRRSLSIEGMGAVTASAQTQTARVIYTTASSTPGSASPVKITISKSPQARAIVSQPGGQPPKVILVTSSSQSSASSVYQRSMSVPVIRASTSTSTSHSGATRTSIIIPGGSPGIAHNSAMPGVVTVTTNSITTSTSAAVTMPTSVVGGSPVFSPSVSIGKPRAKVVTRHRLPQPSKPGVVIPMGPGGGCQPVAPSPQSLHNIHVKTVAKPPPIHIKQEGGMKIITQTGASKILPKPAQLSGSPGTPVVVVNAGPSASGGGSTTVTMVPKTVGSYTTSSGSKVLNISAPGGRVIANTKAPNVVTVNPKTLQLTAVKSAAGGTTVSKPNVIVVQKTQPRRPPLPTQIGKTGTTVIAGSSTFEKELANFIQKESGRVSVSISPSGTVASTAAIGVRPEQQHRVIITTAGNMDPSRQTTVQKQTTDAENRTSLLAELIQASGLVEGGSETSGNEWFEFDDTGQSGTHDSLPASSSMPTLVSLPNSGAKIVQRSSSGEDHTGVAQEHYYSLEQAMSLLNSDSSEGETVITSQPMSRIVSSSGGERILTTQGGGIGRRLSASVVAEKGGVQRGSDLDNSSRSTDLSDMQQFHQSGELDPQTGLFYSAGGSSSGQQIMVRDGSILTTQVPVTVPRRTSVPVAETRQVSLQPAARPVVQNVISVPVRNQQPPPNQAPPGQHMDLVRSSLAQAQINLESFGFGDEGLDPYPPMEADSGEVAVVAGGGEELVDQHQFEIGEGGNFDAHTALLEESEAGAAELMSTVQPVASQVGITTTLPASETLAPSPQSQQQQQQHQQQQHQPPSTQPSVPVSRQPGRSATFIPLEEAKGTRSSTINVVTREQRDLPSAAYVSATTVTSNNTVPSTTAVVVSSNSNSTAPPPPPSTSALHNSKVFTATSVSTPTVSISLSPSVAQSCPTTRLSPLPPASNTAASQNSVQSGVVSVLPQSTVANNSSGGGAPYVSVTSSAPSGPRNSVALKSSLLTASPSPQLPPHTVVLDTSAVSAGSSDVPRTIGSLATVTSVSSVVVGTPNAGVIARGGNVAVLGDGHTPAVNSRVDGHTPTDSGVTVRPLGERLSEAVSLSGAPSVVEFTTLASSSLVDQEVDLIAVGDAGSSDKTADGLNYDANALRQSKRKRKPPSALEEAAGGSAGGSWVRAASNILTKVSRFRGASREKGELNAAAWFTHPVDQADAPDYYNIIKRPMDFSTIRKKLESGVYGQFEEFHADMQLVRDNCFVYNAANTRVYQDCTQVFRFYQQEIDRLLEKSPTKTPTGQTGSPPKKIIRIDKSPGKT